MPVVPASRLHRQRGEVVIAALPLPSVPDDIIQVGALGQEVWEKAGRPVTVGIVPGDGLPGVVSPAISEKRGPAKIGQEGDRSRRRSF